MDRSSDKEPVSDPMLPLVEEYLERLQRGEVVSIEEYCDQHPEQADEICELFPALAVMQELQPEPGATREDHEEDREHPQQIGDYRILAEIGRGGMGVVYEAEQESLGRRVALKVLPRNQYSANNSKLRFQQEARAAAKMHHTNIVPVFEVGEDGTHTFYAMQLILGQSLDHVIEELKQASSGTNVERLHQPASSVGAASSTAIGASTFSGKLSESGSARHNKFYRSVAKLGLQVADALSFAHARGVIHRDIKPSNLLLDGDGVVWVTDFGLAKVDDGGLTQTGDFLGTLRYMSPERFQGKCDVRADIYGLGITLYELVVKRPAFESADRLKLIQLINQSDPIRPRLIDPRIPRDLETIILKSIDKEPRRRYKSARAQEQDLQRFLNDEPIQARRSSLSEQAVRWARRNKAVAASLAALAVMAMVTIGVLLYSLETTGAALKETKSFAARSLLTQADNAFDNRQFQSASILAAASLDIHPSAGATAKLQSARASSVARLKWTSPTFSNVSAIARSANGEFLAAASADDDTIQVWNAATLQFVRRLEGHDDSITSLDFHPSESWLLSASQDQSVRMWDLETGETIWTRSINAAAKSLAIDPRGHWAAAGGVHRGTVWVWDCESGKQNFRFEGDGSPVLVVEFDRQSHRLAAGFEDGKIRLWDLGTTQPQATTLVHSGSVNSLAFFDDGRLVSGGLEGLSVWNGAESRAQSILLAGEAEFTGVQTLALSAAGDELVVGSQSGSIRYWETSTLEEISSDHLNLGSPVTFLAFTSDDHHLLAGIENQGLGSVDQSLRLLSRRTGQPIAWTEGHVDRVRQLAFNANGSRLVSLAADNSIRVWNSERGELITRITGHRGVIQCIATSPDGSLLASSGADNTVRIWEVETTREFTSPRIFESTVGGVAFDPSGEILATATKDQIQFWKVEKSKLVAADRKTIEIDGESLQGRTLAFGPAGSLIACATTRGGIFLWSAETGERVADLRVGGTKPVVGIQFSADGTKLAVHADDYQAFVYDLTDPKTPQKIATVHQNEMRSLVFSPGGDLLVSGGYDPTVILWDVSTSRQICQIEGHHGGIDSLAFAPDGQTLASSSSGAVYAWKVNNGGRTMIHARSLSGKDAPWDDIDSLLISFAFDPSEERLLIKGHWADGYRAVLLNRKTGEQRMFKGGHGGSFDPKGRWVALCTSEGQLDLIALDSTERIPLPNDGRKMKSVVFNVDGCLLAGAAEGDVTIWDTEERTARYSFLAHHGQETHLAFHPTDPFRLASASDDGMIYLWDVSSETPQRLRQFKGHSGRVSRISFSPDGRRLASGDYSPHPQALLWDVESGEVLTRFLGHTDRISDVAISPDGHWLATSSRDRTIRLWDAETGVEIRRFQDHVEDVHSVEFAANGRQLVSASGDGTLRFRDIRTDDPVDLPREQLEQENGLRLDGELVKPIPKRVEWHVEPAHIER